MSATACPACGAPLHAWRSVPCAEPALGAFAVTLQRCTACGTAVTVEAAPPEIHEIGAYAGGTPRLHRLARPLLHAFDAQRLRMLRPLVSPGAAVLDIGAGRGRFVAAAAGAGFDARGIEPSERGVRAAQALGAHVVKAGIDDAVIAPGSIDSATLWHVLEHLDDPAGALTHIRDWLAPGGTLLIGVPNLASAQAWVGGERWYHLDVPRHRTHFTPAGLEALLERSGYTLVARHDVLLEHNPFGFWQSLVSRATRQPSYLYNLLKRNVPWRSRDLAVTLAALPLVPFAALAELAAGLAHRGGTIAIAAKRRE